ncbi:aspartic peptidase domain-containing protein [Zopfochytrium polystomum]|nr:aspartic peptidase domain-containing protein [Zopfochytrium polystomum]
MPLAVVFAGGAALLLAVAASSSPVVAAPFVAGNANLASSASTSGGVAISKVMDPSGHNSFRAIDRWAARMSADNSTLRRRATTSSSVALTNSDNFLYTAPVTLGNGQAFTLDLDTGSSDTWFRGAACHSADQSCGVAGQPAVATTTDNTLVATGKSWSTTYGSGMVVGNIYTGPVTMAGMSARILLGVTTHETGFNTVGDGLMGLAFAGISNIAAAAGAAGAAATTSSNWIDALALQNNVFSFYLSAAANGDTGEMTVGGMDPARFTGAVNYHPLVSETYWQLSWAGGTWAVGAAAAGALDGAVNSVIADTGTSLVILDTAAAAGVNAAIGAKYSAAVGAYVVPCSVATTGPNVTLTFGGAAYAIPASVYVLNAGTTAAGAATCISGFTAGAAQATVGILGDVFLRQYYSVFDKANKQVGFALAVHPQ